METLDSCIKVKMSGRIENYQFETLLGKGTFGYDKFIMTTIKQS